MIILGLTGSIATGKSTVAEMFQKKGIPVICADKLARIAVKKGSPGLESIRNTFGKDLITNNGSLNRKRLASLIFADAKLRARLNTIVHPEVVRLFKEKIALHHKKKTPLLLLDIPLLYEAKLEHLCNKILVVYTSPEQQLTRLTKRNRLTAAQAHARIASQISIDHKKSKADVVIDNSGMLAETQKQVVQLLKKNGASFR